MIIPKWPFEPNTTTGILRLGASSLNCTWTENYGGSGGRLSVPRDEAGSLFGSPTDPRWALGWLTARSNFRRYNSLCDHPSLLPFTRKDKSAQKGKGDEVNTRRYHKWERWLRQRDKNCSPRLCAMCVLFLRRLPSGNQGLPSDPGDPERTGGEGVGGLGDLRPPDFYYTFRGLPCRSLRNITR